MEETKVYNREHIKEALIEKTIKEVYEILEERGYDPINQITGYLISGDPGYISSHKEARKKLAKFDRTQVLTFILKKYMEK